MSNVDQLAQKLAEVKANIELLESSRLALSRQIIDSIDGEATSVNIDGEKYNCKIVSGETLKIDQNGIWNSLNEEQRELVYDKTLNNSKLERAIEQGVIDQDVLLNNSTIVPRRQYLSFNRIR